MAKVDVVVPCYNYGRFLQACVHSVLRQSVADCRVLIIDDASSDDSVAVAERLAREDRRVSVIAHAHNRGHIRTYNEGIEWASGEYFVLLSADDLLTPGSLKRSLSLFDRDPEIGFVYGRPRHFSGAIPPPRMGKQQWTLWPGLDWIEIRYRKAVNCISQPEAIIRMSALHRAGPYYSEHLPHTADLELWLRLAAVAPVGHIAGVDQGYYRIHPNSMQRTINAGTLNDLKGRRAAFLGALSLISEEPAYRDRLEAMVRRQLAVHALDFCCRAYDRQRTDRIPIDELVAFAAETFPGLTRYRNGGDSSGGVGAVRAAAGRRDRSWLR